MYIHRSKSMGKGTKPVKSARRRNLPCHIAKYHYVAIWVYLSERTRFLCVSFCLFFRCCCFVNSSWGLVVFKGLLALTLRFTSKVNFIFTLRMSRWFMITAANNDNSNKQTNTKNNFIYISELLQEDLAFILSKFMHNAIFHRHFLPE